MQHVVRPLRVQRVELGKHRHLSSQEGEIAQLKSEVKAYQVGEGYLDKSDISQ